MVQGYSEPAPLPLLASDLLVDLTDLDSRPSSMEGQVEQGDLTNTGRTCVIYAK